MVSKRIIPCLLLKDESLVKTKQFKNPSYIGDAINTVRIFNELEVDELILLDITSTKNTTEPRYKYLEEIASECFMPLAYGGGIKTLDQAKKIISIGYEKIIINSALYHDISIIGEIATELGSQAIIGSIDVKKDFFGRYFCYSHSGKIKHKKNPIEWIKMLENEGVGELMITSVDNEGTWNGFDLGLMAKIVETTSIPIIAHGGAGCYQDIEDLFLSDISAAAVGNLVVYQKKGMGVLINRSNISKND